MAAKAFSAPGVAMSRPSGNRGVPKILVLAVRNTTKAFLGSSPYEAAGLESLGLGPGLTVLMGLPPPMPSAMAFKMSTSTTILVPTARSLCS